MGGVLAAYLVTLGIVGYRWETGPGQAPPPITVAAAGGIMAGCALAGRANERLGNTLAWATVLAALFAPRSKLAPVRQAFTPDQFITPNGGPARHTPGDRNSPRPQKGHIYYEIAPDHKGYIPVDSSGRPIPGGHEVPRLLPGMHMYPGAGGMPS